MARLLMKDQDSQLNGSWENGLVRNGSVDCHARQQETKTPLPPLESLQRWDDDDPLAFRLSSGKRKRARIYGSIVVSLLILERWLELGERPDKYLIDTISTALSRQEMTDQGKQCSSSAAMLRASIQQLWENSVDDIEGLKLLVQKMRQFLWQNALEPAADTHLSVGPSRIPGAQHGLFAAQKLAKHSICCYYSGDLHNACSWQRLDDASYVLRIGAVSSRPWWYDALCERVDERTFESSGPGSIYSKLRIVWDRIMAETRRSEDFFVNPTNLQIKARYINDCLDPTRHNVTFVLDPTHDRAAVVTLRDIDVGEELYVSYGQAYWDYLEAATDIVPRKLSDC